MSDLSATTTSRTRPAPRSILPYLALAVGIFGLGFSGIFVKLADAPGPVTGFYRMAIAGVILAMPFARRVRRSGPITRRALSLALLGGVFFALDLAFWNTSVHMTSAANATLLGNTSPLWVGLGAFFIFHERRRVKFWAGLFLGMLGAAFILGTDALRHPVLGWGDAMALTAGLFYGMYFLATQRGREHLDALTYFWISVVSCTVVLLLVSLAFGYSLTGYSANTYLAFIALGLLTQAMGYLAVSYALGHLPASVVAPTMLGQPILTAILAVPLLGEPITAFQLLGGSAVILGVYLIHRESREGEAR